MKHTCILLCVLLLSMGLGYAQRYATGLVFDEEGYEAVPLKKPVLRRNYENLPASVSLKAYCPQPQDQGAVANCVGWAAGYAARTILEALQQQEVAQAVITGQAFSPDFLYLLNKSPADAACRGGISINQALKTMQEKGVPRRREFAAGCVPEVPPAILTRARPYRIEGYARLFDKEAPDDFRIRAIKKSLSQQKPLVIGLECYESFKRAGEYWDGIKDRFIGGHALCVIGYDEQRSAFEVMNSWGADWGKAGFTWMRYTDLAGVLKYAFELIGGSAGGVTAAGAAPAGKTLSGSVELILASGEKIAFAPAAKPDRGLKAVKEGPLRGVHYQSGRGYPSGTRYRLYLTNEEPAYVYVFGSDLTGAVGQIFPPDEHTSPHLSYPGNAVVLPDESWYIETDNTVGTDFIGIVYSLQPLDMSGMVEQLNRSPSPFPDKLRAILGDRLIPDDRVIYQADRMGFQAVSSAHTALAAIIALEHTAN